jgi:hypothetical protein
LFMDTVVRKKFFILLRIKKNWLFDSK